MYVPAGSDPIGVWVPLGGSSTDQLRFARQRQSLAQRCYCGHGERDRSFSVPSPLHLAHSYLGSSLRGLRSVLLSHYRLNRAVDIEQTTQESHPNGHRPLRSQPYGRPPSRNPARARQARHIRSAIAMPCQSFENLNAWSIGPLGVTWTRRACYAG